jgi:hypothetical protein
MSPSFHQPEPRGRWFPRLALLFLVVSAASVGVAWSAVGAGADVVVLSEPSEMAVRTEFVIGSGENRLPGKVVALTETVTGTFPTAGGAAAPVAPASGPVRAAGSVSIVSTYSRAQTLVERTRVATEDGRVYRITKAVTVPAGGKVTVDAAADVVGESQALAAGTTLTIPGLNADTRRFFTVTPTAAFELRPESAAAPVATGSRSTVTLAAVDAAVSGLEQKADLSLAAKANGEAGNFAAAGTTFAFSTQRRVVTPDIGTAGDAFTVTLERKVVAVFYDKGVFEAELARRAADQAPFGRVLGRVVSEATAVTVAAVDEKAGSATLSATGMALTTVSSQAPALATAQFVGITAEAAKKYAERVAGVASVSVKLRPFWLGTLPKDPGRIRVEVR